MSEERQCAVTPAPSLGVPIPPNTIVIFSCSRTPQFSSTVVVQKHLQWKDLHQKMRKDLQWKDPHQNSKMRKDCIRSTCIKSTGIRAPPYARGGPVRPIAGVCAAGEAATLTNSGAAETMR